MVHQFRVLRALSKGFYMSMPKIARITGLSSQETWNAIHSIQQFEKDIVLGKDCIDKNQIVFKYIATKKAVDILRAHSTWIDYIQATREARYANAE